MKYILQTIQIIIATSIIALILLQAKGVGLGRTFGGGGEFYKSKRGVEKIVFYLTIFAVSVFLLSSVISLFYS
ncbi:preprotein translocase subunit SecG [Candidatus Gottesmanbacteria bacterium]|nr:preprotein translocase subunit SecG [Candidatus Gottesmanbacteria bacterium]